ncbi:hypothetical protein NQ318_017321 [Aromia moschata]|uniref:Uncharacterized protein n=1 Tax=Aromia moschata TaxID=1265417 RepID=A0AAV8XVR1_9CUCU|nr:hypothetical protein NQ318_017321 [Aromia moschata]
MYILHLSRIECSYPRAKYKEILQGGSYKFPLVCAKSILRLKEQRFKNFVKDDEFMIIVRHYLKRHVKSYTVLAAKEIQIRGKINHVSRSHTLTACVTDPTNVIFQLNVKEQTNFYPTLSSRAIY